MSKRKVRHYTEEFKLKAVKLCQVNGNINQTSRDLNVPYSVLQRWCKEYDKYGDNSFPEKGKSKLTDQEKEIVDLENQLREIQLENDILKKAISTLLQERQEKYQFIKHHKLKFPVEKMCKVLGISSSSYYSWLQLDSSKRWQEDEIIMILIKYIFNASYQSYGAPRIKIELETFGYYASRRKINKMMRAMFLYVKLTRKFKITTDSKHTLLINTALCLNFK